MAERRGEELRAALAVLEADAADAEAEIPVLAGRARELAEALSRRPRLASEAAAAPGPDLERIAEWATQARAALFVARGALAAERDALIRQASELGSAVLGEPIAAAGAAEIVRRVERAASSPS